MSRSRLTAIIIVALLHALLGYAFITGLAYNVVKKVAKDLKTFDVTEEPPPPPEKPPPPPPKTNEPPPVVSPPPLVRVNTPTPPTVTVVNTAPPVVQVPPVVAAPPPPPPPPRVAASRASPRGNPSGWATDEDYPPSALREEAQGTTGFHLEIGADGRVTNCSVTSSSGNTTLDETTCKLVSRRARFTPAKDSSGSPVTDTYNNRIVWRIPKD